MTELDTLLDKRRLDREDLQIQFDEVICAMYRGHWATARATLAGAKMLLEAIRPTCFKPLKRPGHPLGAGPSFESGGGALPARRKGGNPPRHTISYKRALSLGRCRRFG